MEKYLYKDYTDAKRKVLISTPLFKKVPDFLKELDYDFSYQYQDDGIIIETAIQMIPEIISVLVENNQAIYQVIVLEN